MTDLNAGEGVTFSDAVEDDEMQGSEVTSMTWPAGTLAVIQHVFPDIPYAEVEIVGFHRLMTVERAFLRKV